MTCEEFRAAFLTDPEAATLAYLSAVANHAYGCDKCNRWRKSMTPIVRSLLSPEELAESDAVAGRVADRLLLANDPEAPAP